MAGVLESVRLALTSFESDVSSWKVAVLVPWRKKPLVVLENVGSVSNSGLKGDLFAFTRKRRNVISKRSARRTKKGGRC